MRFRTWPVAALGFVGLLALVALSLHDATRRIETIYGHLDARLANHREVQSSLTTLRSDLQRSAVAVRDYLLEQDPNLVAGFRTRLAQLRDAHAATLAQLEARVEPEDRDSIGNLRQGLNAYWTAYDPLFGWTVDQRRTRSAVFLRTEVLPRRNAVLAIVVEIERLNDRNLAAERAAASGRQVSMQSELNRLLWQTLGVGVLVAAGAVLRLRVLERRAEAQRHEAQAAESRMRQLSQQLVAAQEEERRKLSRELHDHVGQMLTALRMELGRIERLRMPHNTAVSHAVAESRTLVDDMVRTVRDLALGLRPSMLDDLGLQSAVEWHVRDFQRRFGLTVDLKIETGLDGLPDQYRTCIYRVVQEALTNCARHSRASVVTIRLSRDDGHLHLSIADDGVGMEPVTRRTGLGLRGLEERVRELDGQMTVDRSEKGGTLLEVTLPIEYQASEGARASLAG